MKLLILVTIGLLIFCYACEAQWVLKRKHPNGETTRSRSRYGSMERKPLIAITEKPEVETTQEPEPQPEDTTKLITVDAAIGYKDGENQILELFAGDKVQILKNNVATELQDREDFDLPKKLRLQAAFAAPNNINRKYFYGNKHGYFRLYSDPTKNKRFKYGKARKFLRGGGPDAAGKLGQKVFFFKGCEMAVRHGWKKWGKPQDVQSVGLPCDVDAAWSDSEGMRVLKGDQIWLCQERKGAISVQGPSSFHDHYQLLDGWRLKPTPEQQTQGH